MRHGRVSRGSHKRFQRVYWYFHMNLLAESNLDLRHTRTAAASRYHPRARGCADARAPSDSPARGCPQNYARGLPARPGGRNAPAAAWERSSAPLWWKPLPLPPPSTALTGTALGLNRLAAPPPPAPAPCPLRSGLHDSWGCQQRAPAVPEQEI
jgi:hypothetical protein